MPEFKFKATTANGKIENGTLTARSRIEAYEAIIERKLIPVSIERGGSIEATSAIRSAELPRKLSGANLLLFTEELSELLEAGLQLEPALRIIESRKEQSPLKAIGAELRQQVRDGVSFSNALRSCGTCFPELFCSLVEAGESAGALPKILRRQAEYFTIMADLKKRVTMALVYPSIVFSAGILLLLIFMTVLLPQLTVLLSKTGKGLPLMTKILVGASEFLGHYWWALVILIAAGALGLKAWRTTPDGGFAFDRFQLNVPLLGGVLRTQFLAEFSQTLATLVANGVTLIASLALIQKATANRYIKQMLGRIVERIAEGAALSSVLRQIPFFPSVFVDIITVGEQTGDLTGALQRSARKYDREFGHRIQQMTAFIQPLTILIVAVFVGVVAYSMITGILTSVSGLRSR